MSTPPRPAALPVRRRTAPFPIYDAPDDLARFIDRGLDGTSAQSSAASSPVELPAGHFLARPQVVPRPVQQQPREREWERHARPDTSSLAAADFDVSVLTGFLPPEEPVSDLRTEGVGRAWCVLEELLEEVQKEVREGHKAVGQVGPAWRAKVDSAVQPSTDALANLPQFRRAHVLLSFLGHFYVHSSEPKTTTLPPSIAGPWMDVSKSLGLPPILTYADTVLWNWKLVDPALGLRADNVAITTTFTSLPSEEAFFLFSLLSELSGPAILRLMSSILDELFFADAVACGRIAHYLRHVALLVRELGALMDRGVKGPFGSKGEHIVPQEFYWDIRPWFNGGKWTYGVMEADGERKEKEQDWGGPSAGQSSLVHAIDLFLGVDHAPRPSKTSPAAPAQEATASGANKEETFMMRMATYMPMQHRSFLAHLSSLSVKSPANPHPLPTLRALAMRTTDQALREAYDEAVGAVKAFREAHMRLVTRYIVVPARRPREPVALAVVDELAVKVGKVVAVREEAEAAPVPAAKELKGTGGTDLVKFLKLCKARTVEAFLDGERRA